MSEAQMDLACLDREEDSQKTMGVLVAKERTSTLNASAAAHKKTTGTRIATMLACLLREVGCLHGDMVVKCDHEPALLSMVEDVGRLRVADGSGRYVVECSPVGAIQSNEKAIQSVSGQTRVLLCALEGNWKCCMPYDHPLLCYFVE